MLTKPCCIIDSAESRHQNPAKFFKIKNKEDPLTWAIWFFSKQPPWNPHYLFFFFTSTELVGDELKNYTLILNRSKTCSKSIKLTCQLMAVHDIVFGGKSQYKWHLRNGWKNCNIDHILGTTIVPLLKLPEFNYMYYDYVQECLILGNTYQRI